MVAAGSLQIEEAAVPGCQDAEAAEFFMWLVAGLCFEVAGSRHMLETLRPWRVEAQAAS